MHCIYTILIVILSILFIKYLWSAIARAHTKFIINKAKSNIMYKEPKSALTAPSTAQEKINLIAKDPSSIIALAFQSEKAAYTAKIQENPLDNQLHFLDYIYVAGTRHHDIVQSNMQHPGNLLRISREESNPHDCNAIALNSSNGSKIGYIPRKYNSIPAAMMDAGYPLTVKICSVHASSEAPIIRAAIYVQPNQNKEPEVPDILMSYAPSEAFEFSANRLHIDANVIQSIIDDKKQELCPLRSHMKSHIFVDLILVQPCDISSSLDGAIPLYESNGSFKQLLSLNCVPQNQQTAIRNLINMNYSVFAIVNEELSMFSAGVAIVELYANI